MAHWHNLFFFFRLCPLSNCYIALSFGSQLCFHLQPRNVPKLVVPLARATLSHWTLGSENLWYAVAQWLRIALSMGSTTAGAFLAWRGKQSWLPTRRELYYNSTKSKKRWLNQWAIYHCHNHIVLKMVVQTHSSNCMLFNSAMSTEDYTMLSDKESQTALGRIWEEAVYV